MKTINFTRAKLEQLKEAYFEAGEMNAEQFDFEGHPMLTAYARYLIEYLELNFKPDTRKIPINYI